MTLLMSVNCFGFFTARAVCGMNLFECTMNKYCFNQVSTSVAHHFIDYVSVIKTSIVSWLTLFLQVTPQNWIACCLGPWSWRTLQMRSWQWWHSSRHRMVRTWREGTIKSCFNYLLLDPRVTQNLPLRAKTLSEHITPVYCMCMHCVVFKCHVSVHNVHSVCAFWQYACFICLSTVSTNNCDVYVSWTCLSGRVCTVCLCEWFLSFSL